MALVWFLYKTKASVVLQSWLVLTSTHTCTLEGSCQAASIVSTWLVSFYTVAVLVGAVFNWQITQLAYTTRDWEGNPQQPHTLTHKPSISGAFLSTVPKTKAGTAWRQWSRGASSVWLIGGGGSQIHHSQNNWLTSRPCRLTVWPARETATNNTPLSTQVQHSAIPLSLSLSFFTHARKSSQTVILHTTMYPLLHVLRPPSWSMSVLLLKSFHVMFITYNKKKTFSLTKR